MNATEPLDRDNGEPAHASRPAGAEQPARPLRTSTAARYPGALASMTSWRRNRSTPAPPVAIVDSVVRSIRASLKNGVKWLLRPFAKPLLVRFRALQQEIEELQKEQRQLAQHLPVLLNAISTLNATAREFERARAELVSRLDDHQGRLDDHQGQLTRTLEAAARVDDHEARLGTLAESLSYVDRRNEFIRREVMYEARYGARSKGVEQVEPRDVDVAALSSGGPLRLNLGSGHIPREGFVNVDSRGLEGVDVVADARQLPFEPGTVDVIFSSHLVEHFPIEELRRVVLPHWLNMLRPGGQLVAVVPDAEAMVRETAEGRMPFDDFQRVMFGDQEYDGDFHFSTFTPDSLAELLTETGFDAVEIVDRARRNGLSHEFEIRGVRATSSESAPEAVPDHIGAPAA
jgi:SAM-dependent methyltransferase